MWSALLRRTQNASIASLAATPVLLVVLSAIRDFGSKPANTLTVTSATWGIIWAHSAFRTGFLSGFGYGNRTKCCFAAGILLLLAIFCERAACSWDTIWWPKSLLPATLYLIVRSDILQNPLLPVNEAKIHDDETLHQRDNQWYLLIVTGSSLVVLGYSYNTFQNVTLGFCNVLLTAAGLITLEHSIKFATIGSHSSVPGLVSANGSLHRRAIKNDGYDPATVSLRDVSGTIMTLSGIGALFAGNVRLDTLLYPSEYSNPVDSIWNYSRRIRGTAQLFFVTVIGVGHVFLCFKMLRRHGPIPTGFAVLGGALIAQLVQVPSLNNLWFIAICSASASLYLSEGAFFPSISLGSGKSMRTKSAVFIVALLSFTLLMFSLLFRTPHTPALEFSPRKHNFFGSGTYEHGYADIPSETHPVHNLIHDAQIELQETMNRQSKSLSEAVKEYKRRYSISPPPQFDRWYEFAKRRNVQLIDEFDTIHHSLLPFWAFEPYLLRKRTREALGYEENLLTGVLIRDGQTVFVKGKSDWLKEAIVGMMAEFKQFLPDMDLAFNEHDEPRIMVPSVRLSAIIELANSERAAIQKSRQNPRNYYSSRPDDLNDGSRIDEFRRSKFNRFAHQATWTHSRLSCPPDSPAQNFKEMAADNTSSYALGKLGFIYNLTAFTDICMSPSFEETYGFFDRPNAFSIAHELIPIFSQSKISSYQDILYPSPWYWYEKVKYEESKDFSWSEKEEKLYWRGSTTGGFSRNGGWRRHHRQRLVKVMNAPDIAQVLTNTSDTAASNWEVQDVDRNDFKDIVDVKFSYIGQCDPDDCKAQEEFFDVVGKADQQDAWKYKYLLDMDGNAFSGRFYAFLRSRSLAFKMAIFREWHMEWLKPWLHYIPLSLKGDEWLESVRYLVKEPAGRAEAEHLAVESRNWAEKVLRNEDLEVWLFRLLLEYGRVIDDDRAIIGYSGA